MGSEMCIRDRDHTPLVGLQESCQGVHAEEQDLHTIQARRLCIRCTEETHALFFEKSDEKKDLCKRNYDLSPWIDLKLKYHLRFLECEFRPNSPSKASS